MTSTSRRYRSYLIRLWRSESDDTSIWHASTEDTRTGERRNFAGISQLFCFLEQQTREPQTDDTTTQAVRDGDDWIISGTKSWVTSGSHAGVIITMARTDTPKERKGARGIGAFIVYLAITRR